MVGIVQIVVVVLRWMPVVEEVEIVPGVVLHLPSEAVAVPSFCFEPVELEKLARA